MKPSIPTDKYRPKWDELLTAEAELELKEVGRLLSVARKGRGMSMMELANRLGVDRRTLSQLEKGSPKVSLGIFFQVLSALNLLQGIEEALKPENDIESISFAVRRARQHRTPTKKINKDKVNF